jgi:sensor histidine kinase YesM
MKKYVIFAAIFSVIGYVFYLGNASFSEWKEKIKYGLKDGDELNRFNEGDLYVLEDSLHNMSYFKTIGKVSGSDICIRYGNNPSLLPKDLKTSAVIQQKGFFIDNSKSWVEEILNDDNFDNDVRLVSNGEWDKMLTNNKVYGYERTEPKTSLGYKFMLSYHFGSPLILICVVLIFFILFYIFSTFTNLYFTRKNKLYKSAFIIFIISIYAFLNNQMMIFSYGPKWIGFFYILMTNSLVWGLFQIIKAKTDDRPFEKKEVIKFLIIIVLGLSIEFLFKSALDLFFFKGIDDYKLHFQFILIGSFKFWTLIATANFLNNLISYISSLRRKSKQLQTVTSDAQISADALQQSEAHVNTHFLYNSLHAIAALAPVAPDKTETLALSLAKYYRYTTNRNDEIWITIKEEIEALTAYLEVEKIRLGEKLNYAFDVSDDVSGVKIPKFLLQPLVENAVKYGYYVDKDTTNVKLSFHILDHTILKISVCDSGKAFGDQMEIGKGIRQVKDLLKRFYPEGHTISFVNEPVKCVEIIINKKNINQ